MILNKITIFFLAVITSLLVLIGFLVFNKNADTTIVLDSNKVFENYQGFKEAQDIYEKKIESMSESYKAQNMFFEKKKLEFGKLKGKLTKAQIKIHENELVGIRNTLTQLKKAIATKSINEEQKILDGVYNKVNDFVKRYAEKNNIELVLGANASGTIIYSSHIVDKTDKIIELLNREYTDGVQ